MYFVTNESFPVSYHFLVFAYDKISFLCRHTHTHTSQNAINIHHCQSLSENRRILCLFNVHSASFRIYCKVKRENFVSFFVWIETIICRYHQSSVGRTLKLYRGHRDLFRAEVNCVLCCDVTLELNTFSLETTTHTQKVYTKKITKTKQKKQKQKQKMYDKNKKCDTMAAIGG